MDEVGRAYLDALTSDARDPVRIACERQRIIAHLHQAAYDKELVVTGLRTHLETALRLLLGDPFELGVVDAVLAFLDCFDSGEKPSHARGEILRYLYRASRDLTVPLTGIGVAVENARRKAQESNDQFDNGSIETIASLLAEIEAVRALIEPLRNSPARPLLAGLLREGELMLDEIADEADANRALIDMLQSDHYLCVDGPKDMRFCRITDKGARAIALAGRFLPHAT